MSKRCPLCGLYPYAPARHPPAFPFAAGVVVTLVILSLCSIVFG